MKKRSYIKIIILHIQQTFSPPENSLLAIEKRLKNYDMIELQNLSENFIRFGVDKVLECFLEYL